MLTAATPLSLCDSLSLLKSFGRRRGSSGTLLIHPSGGGLGRYMAVIHHLARRGPVYGIRAAGLEPHERPDDSVPAMLRRYLPLVQALREPPSLVMGWSLGGVLAWELAAALAQTGRRPAVIMVDSFAEPWSACRENRAGLLGQIVAQAPPSDEGAKHRLMETAAAHLTASAEHHASTRYDGPVLLMPCRGEQRDTQVAAWARRSPRLIVRDLPCGHFDVFQPPNRRLVIRHLDNFRSALSFRESL